MPPEGDASADEAAECQQRVLGAAAEAIDQATSIIPEIEALIDRLQKRLRPPSHTGLPMLLRQLGRHRDVLRLMAEKLSSGPLTSDELKPWQKKLDSSGIPTNLGYIQWSILKRCRSLVAVNQSFPGYDRESLQAQISQRQRTGGQGHPAKLSGRDKHAVYKDLKSRARVEVAVVDDGAEWIDIRTLTRDRLVRDMTDAGWAWGEHTDPDEHVDPDEWEGVLLAAQVRRLVEAARRNRHDYVVPRVRVVMPKMRRGGMHELDVDVFLAQLTRLDPHVHVTIEDRDSQFLTDELPPLDVVLDNLEGDELAGLTPSLNLDHTALIDLISDFTHRRLTHQPWHTENTRAQIEEELSSENGVMAPSLYTVLRGRRLVCTSEAAEHLHDILRTVGTPDERQRGRLLIPRDEETLSLADDEIRTLFNSLSIRPLPPDVQIPITILPTSWGRESAVADAVADGRLPRVALDVARGSGFAAHKLATFMQGWASGDVTVTSNKEANGKIRTLVEKYRRDEGDAGPRIYSLEVTRNLLSKNATPPEPGESG